MQFLWKYVDDMVGKGLDFIVIIKLLFYACANLVPMALPLAILLASIMTFGNLGENYELVAMKSSGLSLQKIMIPLIVVIIMTSGAAFFFSNNIWPVANLKMKSLLFDVTHKKPALEIKEKIYYSGIDGYIIRVGKKESDGQSLKDITIYDHTQNRGNVKVIKATSGTMKMSADEQFLIVTLNDGCSYEDIEPDQNTQQSFPFFRSTFQQEVLRFDLSSFSFMRTDESLFKDNYEMLNVVQLSDAKDSVAKTWVEKNIDFNAFLNTKYLPLRDTTGLMTNVDTVLSGHILTGLSKNERIKVIETAINLTRNTVTYVSAIKDDLNSKKNSIIRYQIEWHRKFTLSYACIVLFFIGAPLGAIIRKGGLGMPVVISVILFLILHVISISGEKVAKQGAIDPYLGMWMASVVLTPVGVFLTYKAGTDSVIMNAEFYTNLLKPIQPVLSKIQSFFTKK